MSKDGSNELDDEDEIEIDIESLDVLTLRKLYRFVDDCLEGERREKEMKKKAARDAVLELKRRRGDDDHSD